MTMQYTDKHGFLITRLGPGNMYGKLVLREAPGGKGPYYWGTEDGTTAVWEEISEAMYRELMQDAKSKWPSAKPEPKPKPKDSSKIPPIAWVGAAAFIIGVAIFIKVAMAAGFY